MAQNLKVRGTATEILCTFSSLDVIYHGTIVAQLFPDGTVRLHSGGWRTVTTKRRMNQFANQFAGSSFSVYQHKGIWYINKRLTHETLLYEDNIQFNPTEPE